MRKWTMLMAVLLALSLIVGGCGGDDKKSDPETDVLAEVAADVVEGDVVEPEEDVVEPEEDVVEPEEDVVEPEEDVVEPEEDVTEPEPTEFELLSAYLEGDGGNYINTTAPKIIGAADVMADGLENWVILDIRKKDKYGHDGDGVWQKGANGTPDFDDGHIEGAQSVGLAELPAFAEANLTADDKILVACYTGHDAGHAVLILNLLGYDAYSLKWGMSGWHKDFDLWTSHTGSDFTDQFVMDEAPAKPEAGEFPMVDTGEEAAEGILDARIAWLLENGPMYMTWTDYFAAPDDFFVVNYWGGEDYLGMGHIDGAYQYTPKSSMHTEADLATLPTDKTIAVYCYSGQHGSQLAAYLAILGYDARDVKFGTNGVMYDAMTSHTWPGADTGPAGFDYVGMVEPPSEFELLVDYLQGENGNYINTSAPKVIGAADVMAEGLENWVILDIRTKDKYGPDGDGVWQMEPNGTPDFEDGHIEGALTVALVDLPTYAEANLTADDKILIACYTGHDAGHAVLILNLLGFDAYSLKFGMSGWNATFDYWTSHTGSDFVDQFTTDPDTGKNAAGDYPTLETGAATATDILDARIGWLLDNGPMYVKWTDVAAAPDDYYIVNYWPEAEYLDPGHYVGSHQYDPKSSMHTDADLATLPTDMPIAIYCYTGQHGSQLAAYLSLLGYEARDVKFGTNAVIFDNMPKKQWPGSADFAWVTD